MASTALFHTRPVRARDESAASLRAFRKAVRYTMQEMADAVGIPLGRWKNYEYGKAAAPVKVVQELRRLGYGQAPRPQADTILGRPMIPVGFSLASMPFAGDVPAGDWGEPLESQEFVEMEVKYEHPKRFVARVVGDSCHPALMQGDLTVWHQDFAPPYGVIVLAQRKGDHGCTVKELRYVEGRPVLAAVNPAYDPPEDGEGWGVVARLVGVIRRADGPEKTWFWEPGIRPRDLA